MFKNIFIPQSKKNISLENDIFPDLVNKKKLSAYKSDGYFIDIGTLESLKSAREEFHDNIYKPALFVDRDGTLNHDDGYTHKPEDLVILPGVVDGIREAMNNNFYVICVTNQGGISKEIFSENDMQEFNEKLLYELRNKGANIDKFLFLPASSRFEKYYDERL